MLEKIKSFAREKSMEAMPFICEFSMRFVLRKGFHLMLLYAGMPNLIVVGMV